VVEKLGAGYLGNDVKYVVVYAVLLLVLLVRPYGLFGEREIVRV
jgi:branched-chain amino acid transport system permease protein